MLTKEILELVNSPHVWKDDAFTLATLVKERTKERCADVLENNDQSDLAILIRAL